MGLRGKMKIEWGLYAKAIFPLMLWVCLLVNLQVVPRDQEKTLEASKNQNLLPPIKRFVKPVSKISSNENPPQSLRSSGSFLIVNETIREVTAYNAGDPNQNLGDPCVSASGENICSVLKAGHKRCAANFVPLGTMIKIDKFGVCKVTDRMNKRYKNRVDIAMRKHEKDKALKFGLQKLSVQILERNT